MSRSNEQLLQNCKRITYRYSWSPRLLPWFWPCAVIFGYCRDFASRSWHEQSLKEKSCCVRETARWRCKVWYVFKLQRHRVVLPAIAWCLLLIVTVLYYGQINNDDDDVDDDSPAPTLSATNTMYSVQHHRRMDRQTTVWCQQPIIMPTVGHEVSMNCPGKNNLESYAFHSNGHISASSVVCWRVLTVTV